MRRWRPAQDPLDQLQLSSSPGNAITLVCQDWANTKAVWQWLDNERVNEADILAGHFHATRD